MDTKRLRQRVLDLAIHGKLVPQNPQDESASELLKRIAKEKERLVKEGKIKKSKKKDNEDLDEVPFEVPQGWVWTKLGDVVMAVTDGDHMPPPQSTTGIPFLVISDVNEGFIKFEKARFVPQKYYDNLPEIRKAERGDILFTVTGSYGIVIPVDTDVNFCFQRHIGLIKVIESREWLSYILRSQYVKHYCDEHATGTAQKTVGLETLRMLQIPLPPLAEQHRIVSEVEKYFSLIDIVEESKNDLQQSIQKARSKILDSAISGKLIKIEGNYKEVRLNSLAVDSADGPFGSNLKREHYTTNKEVRIIQLSNIGEDGWRDENTKYTTFEHLPNIARSEVHPGDIVIAKMMPAGRAILCPTGDPKYVLSSDAVKFVLKEGIYNKYVLYAINSSHFREQVYDNVQGVTRVRTSLKKLREYTIPIPSLSEQYKIVERIEMLNQQLDNIAEALK